MAESSRARQPDMQVRAVVSHGPGVASSVGIDTRRIDLPSVKSSSVRQPVTPAVLAPSGASTISVSANQQGLTANGSAPSDSTGAIGPLHFIEIVNTEVGMYDRNLSPISAVNMATFIGASAGARVGDPQMEWDAQGGRWLYAGLELYSGDDKLAFGWSKGGDSNVLTLGNTDWCNFHIDTFTNLHDYPKLGHDANFILIGANIAANNATFTSASIWAIAKPAAGDMTCTAPTIAEFGSQLNPLRHNAPIAGNFVITPVPGNVADNASTAYIASIDLGYIGVWHVSPMAVGACTGPCLVGDGEVQITAWSPPSAGTEFTVPQPSGGPTLDGLDGRLTQAVQRGDPSVSGAAALWTQHTTQDISGRAIVTWYELVPPLCSGGACGASAKRQEGVIANPNLWVFNGAISPTSHGDAAVIHYNTSSTTSFPDSRVQSHDAGDPLSAMSGEQVLRTSTVADTDGSCRSPFGPPCRWGDYAGASPDPTSCSVVWGTTMLAGDVASSGLPTWVTQNFAVAEGKLRTAVSTQQYTLAGSDGATWWDIDAARLQVGSSPCADATGLITANADLFTSSSGVNQDIAIFVDTDGVAGAAPLAWKESGGFNGTFSPNAAYVQAIFPMPTGHMYKVRLKWKANISTAGTIFAGAGPLSPGTYSPTRLTVQLLPTAPAIAATTAQPKNVASDGATWVPIPGAGTVSLSPLADSRVVLGGNADLFTDTAGFNQDIGITLNGTLIAWKESGGFNGTFSPNAAFVQATAALTHGQSYTAQLVWKTNLKAPSNATIYAGAGPIGGKFSPTSLTAVVFPSGPNPFEAVSTTQHQLTNSDGTNWTDFGAQVTVNSATAANAVIGANVDLWTASAGYNQDLGVFVSDNGGPAQLLVWKESGGFGGTFSPNAAFAETVFAMAGGHSYVFSLKWKTNRATGGSGATIYAGAGPIAAAFSPSRLLLNVVP
jgi:hypothetical protein